jgi:hypothetical protein
MNDRPIAPELVDAVRLYLERELLPTLTDPRLRFQTLVAANVLAIAGRELIDEERQLLEEWCWLSGLLDLPDAPPERLATLRQHVRDGNEALCRRIRAGTFDEADSFRTLAHQLRRVVEAKLAVANPKYLAGAS